MPEPISLRSLHWLIYPFVGALAVLLGYIVVYLAQLSRRKPPRADAGGDNRATTPGA